MALEENTRIEVDFVEIGGGDEGANAVAEMISIHLDTICQETRADEIFLEPQPEPNFLRMQMAASAAVIGGQDEFEDISIKIEVFALKAD